jgi:hypothetical protein
MPRRLADFQTIRSEGGLLPPDLLRRVLDPKEKLPGIQPEDYGLPKGEHLNEVITPSWNRLRKHWAEFRDAAANLSQSEPGTGLTNDKWSLPLLRELGFGLLPATAGPEVGGRVYAINRFFGSVSVHLVGCGLSLDRRAAGVRGAAAVNPHGLVQEFLNRSSDHGWGIVSNGLRLRILRDNQALSRQSFLEFDLEAMFAGEVYSDFVLLWLMAHATRFAPREGDRSDSCWLEQWTKEADERGSRALGDLRVGVERALQILGEGFTSHPRNTALRDSLRKGEVPLADFHGQLLRVVYRLIFLFVAEDRTVDGQSLLHPRDNSEAGKLARERYAAHYGTDRLRELAGKIKGSRHGDLWRQLQLIVGALSADVAFAGAREQLALPVLGSFLWNPNSTAALKDAELTNYDLLEALRHLAFIRQGKVLRPADYKNLGAEELGGVYESLLALTPQISADGTRFNFAEFAGNERKTSGSYYTPDSLVQCLLDSALDPVVDEAIKGKAGAEAEKAILALKVCDPAVGSGHFLVGAAHRLARHLARVRALGQGESEPSPLLYQHALRDVIGRCLYGVDMNPMAAELCRVSLWLEALEPGKPLSFLDHHIRVGNSLLGTTPEFIGAGLPDEAFTAIEGDDKKACAVLKKRNKVERAGIGGLFAQQDAELQARLEQAAAALDELPDERPEDIHAKELAFHRHEHTQEYRDKKKLADAWCAAFVIRKHFREPGRESSARGITQNNVNDLAAGHPLPADLNAETDRLSQEYQFFHWHLAFPEVFANGGFDCVLGNPPWERVKIQEKEWFAERSPEIANASNAAARKRLIGALKSGDPTLYQLFLEHSRQAEGESQLMRNSGRYPFCGRGDINLYAIFAEGMRILLNDHGRVGCVLPTGIATDDTTKFFFRDVMESKSLVSLFDFENRRGLFPAVDSRMKFCLFSSGRGVRPTAEAAEFVFFAHAIENLREPERRFTLSAEDIALLNPNTRTCPIFRSGRDAELTKAIYRRVPVLCPGEAQRENVTAQQGWKVNLFTMLHSSAAAHLFIEPHKLEAVAMRVSNTWITSETIFLPLYEGKMFHQFDHRFASVVMTDNLARPAQPVEATATDHQCPTWLPTPRAWVDGHELDGSCPDGICKTWFLGFKDVASSTNERTLLATVLPRSGIVDSVNLIGLSPDLAGIKCTLLLSNLNAFVLDFVARQKVGGLHIKFYLLNQLPILPPNRLSQLCPWSDHEVMRDWLLPRVLELTYTSWDLGPFAQDCDRFGPPFHWDEERRFLLRCELDAAFFHLYLPAEGNGDWRQAHEETAEDLARLKASFPTPRDAVAYIMDTFPIVRRKDEEKYNGDYRTKRVILEIYDAMQESIGTGQPYQTRVAPPPADPRCCHAKKKIGILAFGSLSVDPGDEILPKIVMRIKTQTPFPVEYGRLSQTRGGAPTLVPHPKGAPVAAQALVLDDSVSIDEARNMLWRRERRRTGSGETYVEGTSPNSVLVRTFTDHSCVETVHYIDFHPSGKIGHPSAVELAQLAIESVKKAEAGKDGISYLMRAIASGIDTPLTKSYVAEIQRITRTNSLPEALKKARG